MRRILAAVLLVTLALLGAMGTALPSASAHQDDQSYLYLDVGERLVARLQMPFGDIEEALGITLDVRGPEVRGRIEANEAALVEYAQTRVEMVGPDGPWEMRPVLTQRAGTYIKHVEVVFEVAHGQDFQEFEVRFDPFFDEIEGRDALLLIADDLRRGIVDNEASHLVRFTPDDRWAEVDLGEPLKWKNFTTNIEIGIDHIRTGADHILFVVALLLPAVLVFRDGWRPANGFVSTLWRATKLMTMFTLAHSITFSLAGIGLLPQPSARLVESVIALSISAAALHNIRPIFPDKEGLIAFAFGLFHGFGFASFVQELDVDRTTQLIALLGRNIGIEIGQIIVVAMLLPGLFLLRRLRIYRPFFLVCSSLLILAGLIWAWERLTESEASIARSIESWTEYPRILWWVAAATAAVVAARVLIGRNAPENLLEPYVATPDE